MGTINLTATLILDFAGILLLVILLLTRGWNLPGRKGESRILLVLIIATMIDCMSDPFVFTMDSQPGVISYMVVFTGNTILFLYNLIMGAGTLALIIKHINKRIPKAHFVFVAIMCVFQLLLLVANIFTPIVFKVDENNTYFRGPAYFVFILCAIILLIYVNVFYFVARKRDGLLRYFPVWEFVLPIVIGVTIQTIYYGISIQPVCFAIAYCGIVTNLQNESLYLDKLTGVYNRYELDKIKEQLLKKRIELIAAMMLDLNDFKSINDKYSHTEGDNALVTFANILTEVVQNKGTVIRFAGDEFVIILHEASDDLLVQLKEDIAKALDDYNEESEKPYKLSAAVGGGIFDIYEGSTSDFMNNIDALMYKNKREYYKQHDRRSR